jgi:hypothetical protein
VANDSQDYEIGYGKPPKTGRFKKGASGNPKGRPKGSKNLTTIILHESRQLVRVNDPHGKREVTKLEAAVMQLSNKSAQGDLRAAKELFALVQRAEEAIPAQPSSEDLPEADQRMMRSILKRMETLTTDTDSTQEEQKYGHV